MSAIIHQGFKSFSDFYLRIRDVVSLFTEQTFAGLHEGDLDGYIVLYTKYAEYFEEKGL